MAELRDLKPADRDWFFETAHNMAVRVCGQMQAHRVDEAKSWAWEYGWKKYRVDQARSHVAQAMRHGTVDWLREQIGRTDGTEKNKAQRIALIQSVGLTYTADNGQEVDRRGVSTSDTYFADLDWLLAFVLHPEQRMLLTLHYVEEYTQTDMAEIRGYSPSRVQQYIKAGLKTLRALPPETFG